MLAGLVKCSTLSEPANEQIEAVQEQVLDSRAPEQLDVAQAERRAEPRRGISTCLIHFNVSDAQKPSHSDERDVGCVEDVVQA